MRVFLYNLSIYLTGLLIRLAALWHPKARKWVVGRTDLFSQLQAAFSQRTHAVVWFHCASVGEFEQARPVIEQFRLQAPGYKILLTFYSPSGYELRKNYDQADWVFYLPLDTPSQARCFVETVQPTVVFFAKYEFWYNFLTQLSQRKIPTFLFSAIFRPNQAFFKWYGSFFRQMLTCFTHIFVQNQASADLLQSIDISAVTAAGDTRIDRVSAIARHPKNIPELEAFKQAKPLLIVGSAWPGDMAILLPFLNTFAEPLKLVIAPHEIHEAGIEKLQKSLARPSVRYSQRNQQTLSDYDTLIIDNVGLLASLYQYADFAYIGGGFTDGIHNILEPAVFGMVIFFGPDYQKFQEAHDLIGLQAAFSVRKSTDFETVFQKFYYDLSLQEKAARTTRQYIGHNAGATQRVLQPCLKKMSE